MNREFLEALVTDEAVIDAILQEHGRIVGDLSFEHELARQVAQAGGRSIKAIRAMLDEQAIRQSDDSQAALTKALRQLKKDSGYLFESPVQQPYAGGRPAPAADYTMEELGKLSMAEYRRIRRGM